MYHLRYHRGHRPSSIREPPVSRRRASQSNSLHPSRPLDASWMRALPGVWTSVAADFSGHTSTRTNGQCTRRGWDAKLLGGLHILVCTHHARWSRRGHAHYPVCELLWRQTSMATLVRARMASARGAVGMRKCWGDPRHRFAPNTPAGRLVDALTTWCVDHC